MTALQNVTPQYSVGTKSTDVFEDEKGAAKRLKVSPAYLAKQRGTGTGPRFAKIGSRVIYKIADLDLWVESRMVHSTSEADQLSNISTDVRSHPTTTPKPAGRRGRPRKADAVTGDK